ncbi:hypothetical protein ACCO45_001756 [Purpureocillium lilacinum]|uniref:Uncharacterized protein n=1 Tax=Purpureocillium lilacinum TaxID=33203 RepID=A0ACC4E931_PURLI
METVLEPSWVALLSRPKGSKGTKGDGHHQKARGEPAPGDQRSTETRTIPRRGKGAWGGRGSTGGRTAGLCLGARVCIIAALPKGQRAQRGAWTMPWLAAMLAISLGVGGPKHPSRGARVPWTTTERCARCFVLRGWCPPPKVPPKAASGGGPGASWKRYSSAQSNDGQHAVATARWHGLKMDAEVMQYEWGFGVLEESGVGSGSTYILLMVQRRSTASCRSKAWTPGQSIVRAQCCEYGTVPYRNVHDEDREGGACPSATVDQNGRDLFFWTLLRMRRWLRSFLGGSSLAVALLVLARMVPRVSAGSKVPALLAVSRDGFTSCDCFTHARSPAFSSPGKAKHQHATNATPKGPQNVQNVKGPSASQWESCPVPSPWVRLSCSHAPASQTHSGTFDGRPGMAWHGMAPGTGTFEACQPFWSPEHRQLCLAGTGTLAALGAGTRAGRQRKVPRTATRGTACAAASVVAALGACLSHWPTCPPRAGDPSCERAGEVASCQHRCNPALPARSSQLQRAWHHETSLESPSPDLLAFSIHPLRGPPAAAIFKPSRRRRPTTAAVCVGRHTLLAHTMPTPAGLPGPRGGRLLSAFSEQTALVRPLPARPWVSRGTCSEPRAQPRDAAAKLALSAQMGAAQRMDAVNSTPSIPDVPADDLPQRCDLPARHAVTRRGPPDRTKPHWTESRTPLWFSIRPLRRGSQRECLHGSDNNASARPCLLGSRLCEPERLTPSILARLPWANLSGQVDRHVPPSQPGSIPGPPKRFALPAPKITYIQSPGSGICALARTIRAKQTVKPSPVKVPQQAFPSPRRLWGPARSALETTSGSNAWSTSRQRNLLRRFFRRRRSCWTQAGAVPCPGGRPASTGAWGLGMMDCAYPQSKPPGEPLWPRGMLCCFCATMFHAENTDDATRVYKSNNPIHVSVLATVPLSQKRERVMMASLEIRADSSLAREIQMSSSAVIGEVRSGVRAGAEKWWAPLLPEELAVEFSDETIDVDCKRIPIQTTDTRTGLDCFATVSSAAGRPSAATATPLASSPSTCAQACHATCWLQDRASARQKRHQKRTSGLRCLRGLAAARIGWLITNLRLLPHLTYAVPRTVFAAAAVGSLRGTSTRCCMYCTCNSNGSIGSLFLVSPGAT